MYTRLLDPLIHSFFLFGPRAIGKSTWLRQHYNDALWINLLRNDQYLELLQDKALFRKMVLGKKSGWVVVDEIQRLPEILNEIHDLIAEHGDKFKFALSGSSARKLKRQGVNLLAGRAITKNFFPLVCKELNFNYDIEHALKYGMLPDVHNKKDIAQDILKSYVGTYLREEIQQEALTRNLDSFQRFLSVAAQVNGEIVNINNISRDCGVTRSTCQNYFDILVDTLVGNFLPAWQPKAKVRERAKPKFYFFDTGIVNALTNDFDFAERGSSVKGQLLETYILHELRAFSEYHNPNLKISYWRGQNQKEVDFIVKYNSMQIGIEVKSSSKWRFEYGKSVREMPLDKRYGVYLGDIELQEDGVDVLPIKSFLRKLYNFEVFT
jgi:predicted AAA+ superfamily ATPase